MFVRICFVILQITACSLQLTRARAYKNNNINPQIVFPGPTQVLGNRHGTHNATDPCGSLTFCTIKPDNYPQQIFNKIFKGKYKEPVFKPTYVQTESRIGVSEEIDNCEAEITYEPLYRVRSNLLSDWRFVAQAPEENFVQTVRVELCKKAGSSCFTKFEGPSDLVASCMQKYSVWEIMVYDAEKGTDTIKVNLPTCCSCYYKTKE